MNNSSENSQNGGKMYPFVLDWMVLYENMHPQESVKGKKKMKQIKFVLTIYMLVKSVLKLGCPARAVHMWRVVQPVTISNCYKKGLMYAMRQQLLSPASDEWPYLGIPAGWQFFADKYVEFDSPNSPESEPDPPNPLGAVQSKVQPLSPKPDPSSVVHSQIL